MVSVSQLAPIREVMAVPYTPILNIEHILQSTLDLMDHTEYPHKNHPAIEHAKQALRDALAAVKEIEDLQALVEQPKSPRTVESIDRNQRKQHR